MVEAGACAIFFPFGPLVYSVRLSVIGTDAEVVVHIASRKGKGVLMGQADTAHRLEPVIITSEVLCRAASDLIFTEFIC